MEFRFVAYDPKTDQRLYQLPRTNSVQIGDTFGTRGTLELKYSAKAIDARDLPTFLKVQAEVTFDNGHTWAEVGPSLLRLSGEHEDTDQAGMRTLRFVGREWILDKARVGTGELELIDGKRPFYQSSPGRIIRTLILEAQDRGAAQGIKLGNFTTDRDAAGNLWPKVATIYYSPGLPIASVLENLVEQGMCDYRMDGDTLNLYAPETAMGRDLTDRANPVRVHSAVTEAPVKYSLEDLASSALLIGDEGFELEVDNPSAPDDYGRLEVTIEQGGVSDPGTARIMVDEALQRGSREIKEITRSQPASGAAFLPYRDYRVGDYVQVLEDGQWQKYRVRELQLTREGQDWTIHAVINDRLQELLLKLAKRTNGIVNGTKGSGGDGTRPTPPENPGIEPAAPEGLVIDQMVYLDRQGIARGQITAGWGAVTESTKGQAVEIGGYELWTRRNETRASWVRAGSTDGELTATHSPVVLSDADGNALEYQWRVRAIAQASNRPGPWSNTVTLTMTQDTTPPPPPSLPTVETDLRIITVDWDGLDEDGERMPVDFNHVRVYFAVAEDMAGAEQVGYLTQTGTWNSGSMPADVPVWVAVSAVDNVGNESDMTPAQSVTPKKLVDDESIRDAVEGIDDKINNAVDDLNQAIDNIVVDASGIATYWMPTEPDENTDPPPKEGFLWFDTSEAGANELHRYVSGEWVSAADQRIDTIKDAQDALEADVDRVRTSVDGKNAITQSTSTPPAQYSGAVGDIWEIMSSMGSGGRSVSRWRWNGTVWVSNLIGDTVLGNVDAAKIGTGYLDADRIQAGTITAEKVLIGSAGNVIPWAPAITTYPHEPRYGTTLTGEVDPEVGALMRVSGGTQADGSAFACLVLGTGDTVPGVANSHTYLPLTPGASYYLSAAMRIDGDVPGDSNAVRYEIQYRDGVGAYLGRQYSEFYYLSNTAPQDVAMDVTAPAGTAFAVVHVHKNFWSSGDLLVRAAELRMRNGATLIEDGAITTGKMAVGAITADSEIVADLSAGVLKSGTIDTARLGAKSITADKLLIGATGNLIPWNLRQTTEPHKAQAGATLSVAQNSSGAVQLAVLDGGGTDNAFAPILIIASGEAKARDAADDLNIAVEGGKTYHLEAGVATYYDTPPGVTAQVRWQVQLLDGNGNYLSRSISDVLNVNWSPQRLLIELETPVNCGYLRVHLEKNYWSQGSLKVESPELRPMSGATLIEDGAITTDKILANAITAGKIAALAIEADHISANAITADKIKAGAIDGKLITGARIRTAASGRRTELDVEGLRSYDSSGNTVLTTQTSDGSIDMRGNLRRVVDGVEISVGDVYSGVNPGIRWEPLNKYYAYNPGIVYSEDTGKDSLFLQGPGSSTGYSYLSLRENGESFRLSAVAASGTWGIDTRSTDGYMRLGSQSNRSPYMFMQRGTGTTGRAWFGYTHPTNDGYAALDLRDRYIWLGAYDSAGNVVSRLWGDSDSTEFTSGTRNMSLRGNTIYLSPTGGLSLNPGDKLYAPGLRRVSSAEHMGRDGDVVLISSSRKYKLIEEPIETTVEDFEDKLLSVDAKTWVDKSRAEMVADNLTAIQNGEEPEEYPAGMGGLERIPGVVAEDMVDAGLDLFVHFEDGEPESVLYDRIGPALIPIIRRLRDRVDALEQQLGATA